MKQGWQIKKLGCLCSFERGLTYSKGDEAAISTKGVLRSNNVDLSSNTLNFDEIKYLKDDIDIPVSKKVKRNSILMCMSNGSKAHLGKVAIIEDDLDYAFGGFMGLLVPDEEAVFPRYFYYALITPMYKSFIKSLSDGANINNLKFADLKEFEIPVPSISEQQRIVALLDAEFAKIDALKANAEKNLQNAKDLFQAALKKELGPKEGWMVKTLKEIGLTQTGTTPKTSVKENYGNYIPFIKPADVNIDGLGNLNYDNEGLSEQGAKCGRVFEANSILMVCIGATIGKVGYAKQKVSSNQQINVLTPNDGYDCKFLYYCMASPRFQFEVIKEGESAKATLPIINKTKWEGLSIAIPSKSAQHSIVARLDVLNEKCKTLQANYEKTIALCDDLKQALLRKAFNGEI